MIQHFKNSLKVNNLNFLDLLRFIRIYCSCLEWKMQKAKLLRWISFLVTIRWDALQIHMCLEKQIINYSKNKLLFGMFAHMSNSFWNQWLWNVTRWKGTCLLTCIIGGLQYFEIMLFIVSFSSHWIILNSHEIVLPPVATHGHSSSTRIVYNILLV